MAKLSQVKQDATQRVVVYGPPKAGKTLLVGQLAAKYKLIWFDLENGHNTLFQLPTAYQDNIELINIRDSRTYPIAAETMLKVIKGDAVDICDAHSKVSCPLCKPKQLPSIRVCLNELGADTILVIDSLTQFTNSCVAHITKAQSDEYKLQLDDWGNLRVLVDKLLSQIQAARYNVICITHEEEVEYVDGTKRIVPVSGSSNSSRFTAKYFDEVVYAGIKNKKHFAASSTNYSVSVLAGSRNNVKLEEDKEDEGLFKIFTSWKQFGKLEETPAVSEVVSKVVASKETSASPATAALTPAQIALANLKAKSQGK